MRAVCSRTIEPGGTTEFLYDGVNVLLERDATGQTTARNTWGPSLGGGIGGLLARRQGAEDTFYCYDGAGNVVALTDAAGVVTQRFAYEAFGNQLTAQGTSPQPYQFSTKREERRSGLLDFGARWYDPMVGRFISPDPVGFADGANLYAYVGNDPVNMIDPVGLAGIPVKLTDVKKLAELRNALEYQRAGVRFRVFQRANGQQYMANTNRGGVFPLAAAARRLDNPAVAQYINPAAAAKGATWGRGGGLTAILVTTQDIAGQLTSGGSLTDPAFLGHTALDVGEGLASGAAGAAAGAWLTSWTLNPAAGMAFGVGVSKITGDALDSLECWVVNRLATGSSDRQ